MGVLSILGMIQNRLCSISRLIFTLTGKSPTPNKSPSFPIIPYQLTPFTTLSSYRPPYRKIPINPCHLSLPIHKITPINYQKSHAHLSKSPINPSHQAIPFSYQSFQQYSIHHASQKVPMFSKYNRQFFTILKISIR